MPAKKWTEQQIQDAAARVQAGEDRDEVAASHGMTWGQLYIAAWKRGLFIGRPEPKQLTRSQLEAAWDRMAKGEHPDRVASSLGTNRQRLGRHMRAAGMPTRWVASRWRASTWGPTIYRMRTAGASTREICAELGIPYYRAQAAKLRDHLIKHCARVHLKIPTIVGQGNNRRLVLLDTPPEWHGAFDDEGRPLKRTERGLPRRGNSTKTRKKPVCVGV